MSILKREYAKIAWWMILPCLVGLIVFRLFPIFVSFFISFTDWNIIGVPKYVGFLNFVEAFSSPLGIKVLINSAQYTLVYVPGVTLLGLFLALVVDTGIRGVTMLRTVYFITYISINSHKTFIL